MSRAETIEIPAARAQDSTDPEFPRLTSDEQKRLAAMLSALYPSAWRVGRRLGLSGAQADEIAQESFAVAARKLPSIEPGHERAFVLEVALRLANNIRRSLANRLEHVSDSADIPEPVDAQPLAEQTLVRKQRCERLDHVLDSMSDAHRDVLMLYEIEGLTLPEIAETLAIPRGTAASRLRRARAEFSRKVRKYATLCERTEKP
jgi:RNA polymerase sigma-70 factor, ECF subfamily